jgi:hypothetical protein
LKYYIKKKNQHFRGYEKLKSTKNYGAFSHYHKLAKITIKIDKLRWLKSSDDNFKTNLKEF